MRDAVLLWAAAAAILLDQLSKNLVVRVMGVAERGSIEVLPPLLTFRYGENRGINFGLFQGNGEAGRWFLIAIAFAICAVVWIWLRRVKAGGLLLASGGLLIGGAVSNVIDRLVYGYVLDFLNMSCCGIDNPFVFNLADVFIFAGAIGLILFDRPGLTGKNAP